MARLLTIPATGYGKPGVRKRTISRPAAAVGPISLQLIVIIATALLGLFYLIQSNQVSTASLQLKQLESQKQQVAEENERLQIEAARLQSIQQIKKSADAGKSSTAQANSAVVSQASNVRAASAT